MSLKKQWVLLESMLEKTRHIVDRIVYALPFSTATTGALGTLYKYFRLAIKCHLLNVIYYFPSSKLTLILKAEGKVRDM